MHASKQGVAIPCSLGWFKPNVIDLRKLPSKSPFRKGGQRGIFITLCKISPNPSLEKRGV
jgi:hypothetical protein